MDIRRRFGGPRGPTHVWWRVWVRPVVGAGLALTLTLAGCTPDADRGRTKGPSAPSGGLYARVPRVVTEVGPSVVEVRAGQGFGSGVVFQAGGIVVTNAHVVRGNKRVTLRPADGTRVTGNVVAADPVTDLAVIRAKRKGLPPASFGTDLPRRGTVVVAMGAPFGFQNSVTAGIVSGLNRVVPDSGQGGRPLVDLIQTDAAISPGNSGGALVDTRGEVVGINEAYIPPQAGAVSIGFAIPSATVVDTVKELLEDGTASHPYLGIRVQPLTRELMNRLDIQANHGVLVAGTDANGPAAQAGLQAGDVITEFRQNRIASIEDLFAALHEVQPGTAVDVEVQRDGKTLDVEIRVGERESGG